MMRSLFFVLICLPLWGGEFPAQNPKIVEKIQLQNDLKLLLISDPNLMQSGGTLVVNIGSFSDPEEHLGMAHFVEHMLFLGTKTYPKESAFQALVSTHGGMTNAFTMSDRTAFIFTIDTEYFEEGLDRFAHFFIDPLFNQEGLERERHAVDQEYQKNIENDAIRTYTLLKACCNKEHPFSRFSMGNHQTLSSVKQDDLTKWTESHYSANLMQAVVYSPLPIEALRAMTVPVFSQILNRHLSPLTVDKKAMNETPQWVTYRPIKNERKLRIVWELPRTIADMRDKQPELLISHLIGHEGEHSLITQLKNANLATAISSGSAPLGEKLFLLQVDITLTQKGVQQVDNVIDQLFQTITPLAETPLPEYIFNELHQIQTLEYQYQEKKNLFDTLMEDAYLIGREPFETYPMQSRVIQTFSPKEVQKLAQTLTPNRALYFLATPDAEEDTFEEWLNIGYTKQNKGPQFASLPKNAPALFPVKNTFIPKEVLPRKQEIHKKSTPELFIDTPRVKLFVEKDTQFFVPKTAINLSLYSQAPQAYIALYAALWKETLSALIYRATCAGIDVNISHKNHEIHLKIEGFDQSPLEVLSALFKTLPPPKKQTFLNVRETLAAKEENCKKQAPIQQTIELFRENIFENYVTHQEMHTELHAIEYNAFVQFWKHFLSTAQIEGIIVTGNTLNQLPELLPETEEKPFKKIKQTILLIGDAGFPKSIETQLNVKGNGILVALIDEDFSFKRKAAHEILMKELQTPFFSELRTKQQTGYIVSSAGQEIDRSLFSFFMIQSDTHQPTELLWRIETFIEQIARSAPTKEQFEQLKTSKIKHLEKGAENLAEQAALHFLLLNEYNGDFQWIEKRIEGVQQLTYEQFLAYRASHLGRINKKRVAVLSNGAKNHSPVFQYTAK